jgi:radical SAM superfamily enzyme YgiQ (UPF0313 family)
MYINQAGRRDHQNYLPLGLLYIAAYLESHGYNAELIDYQLFSRMGEFDAALFVRTIGETAPIVGISCMTNLMPFAVLCAREFKQAHPDIKVVLGGTGPSPVARELIETFPFLDSVVTGEGERPMLDFLRRGVVPVPDRQILENLEEIPLPAYSLVDFRDYDAAPSIISSRGCPYRCAFCTEPHNFGGRVRFRSIESVLSEMQLIHRRSGRTMFLFQDDILPLDRGRFRELMHAFRDLPFPVQWKCFSRVDLMDEELMGEMVRSGCVQVRYGIESGSNRTLKRIHKGFTIESAAEVVRSSVKHFPSVHTSFIWGYPFESAEDFEQTLHYVSLFERMGAGVLLFELSPLPGSEIYREYREGLTFSPEAYSFFVITGQERVGDDGHEMSSGASDVHELMRAHPRVFPGFYTYESALHLRKRQRLDRFKRTRRTPVRGKYDL